MLYYKMVRKTPVESAVWIPGPETDMYDFIDHLESVMPGWVCVGYNVRAVEPGGLV